MMKRTCIALAALATASCATPATMLPTYRDAGIELSGSIEGTLNRDGGCIRVQTGPSDRQAEVMKAMDFSAGAGGEQPAY